MLATDYMCTELSNLVLAKFAIIKIANFSGSLILLGLKVHMYIYIYIYILISIKDC